MSDDTPDAAQTKACSKCGKPYPATCEYFYKHNQTKDGLMPSCKMCHGKATKRWAKANPETVAAISKRSREKHPDRAQAQARNWRKNNQERVREMKRNYRDAHIDQERLRDRLRYQASPEGKRSSSRQWRQNNPERHNALTRNYRARKRHAEGTHTAEDVDRMGRDQKWRCWWCGQDCKDDYEVDHRIPLTRGGSNWPSNLVISCPRCNSSKRDKLPHEWGHRLL